MEANPADVIRSPGPRPDQASPADMADSAQDVTKLFRAHHLELVRLAVLIVGDLGTAEDVVQDAFEQLHRRWRTLRKQSSALDYARSTVLNGSRSVLRRRWSLGGMRPRSSRPGVPPPTPSSCSSSAPS